MLERAIELVLNIAMLFAAGGFVQHYWSCFYERKNKIPKGIMVWLYAIIMTFEFRTGTRHIGFMVLNALLLFTFCAVGYYCEGIKKYIVLGLFCIGKIVTRYYFYQIMGGFPTESTRHDMASLHIASVVTVIFVFAHSFMWEKKQDQFIPNKYFWLLLIVPMGSSVISFLSFYYFADSYYPSIISAILFLFIVACFEIYAKLNENFEMEQERRNYVQQVENVMQGSAIQKSMMQEFRKEKHNLVNELVVLKNSLDSGDIAAADYQINQLLEGRQQSELVINSGNTTIDALINYKYAIAKEKEIAFKLNVRVPSELPMEQGDIAVVLGNALDNAIEAASTCVAHEKVIRVTIGVKKEALMLIVDNPYEFLIKKDAEGKLMSTKEEKQHHGYGISSIQKIADKYQGEMLIEDKNNHFVLTVIMNLI